MATDQQQSADACVLVIFGASGDLTKRKLIPALYNLARSHLLPEGFRVVGFARRELSTEEFRRQTAEAIAKDGPQPLDAEIWKKLEARLYYVAGDYGDPSAFAALRQALEERDREAGTGGNYLYYMATPSEVFATVASQLHRAGLARPQSGATGSGAIGPGATGWRRIVVEKPFGRDLDSARVLNRELQEAFDEAQIFRIDHYLGKETVQNVIVLRFANGIFEPRQSASRGAAATTRPPVLCAT
jgi:glucose-6-phosphate 1-dehydrogenase